MCGEMAYEFDKRHKYVGNDIELWEMAKVYGKWPKHLTNG